MPLLTHSPSNKALEVGLHRDKGWAFFFLWLWVQICTIAQNIFMIDLKLCSWFVTAVYRVCHPRLSGEKTQRKSSCCRGSVGSRSKIQLGLETRSPAPRTKLWQFLKAEGVVAGENTAFVSLYCCCPAKLLSGRSFGGLVNSKHRASGQTDGILLQSGQFVCSQFLPGRGFFLLRRGKAAVGHRFMTWGSRVWSDHCCRHRMMTVVAWAQIWLDCSSVIPAFTHSFISHPCSHFLPLTESGVARFGK